MKISIPAHSVLLAVSVVGWCFVSELAIAQPPGMSPGGMPGMSPGFGGPPPGGMSFGSRGGDRGGGDRGSGGDRGGDRGGFGGPPGGFDPSSFLTRMDVNGNGMLDPDEAQGPARFMLDRMARSNPKIDITKPIPMSVLTESFQQMRSAGPSYGSYGSLDEETPILEKNSLVPGFASIKVEKAPVPGFGASGEKFSVQIDERDLKEADERIGRYDRNRDQQLDENELKEGSFSGTPMQYDKNGDGKLSRQELATRQARRRIASGSPTETSQRKEDSSGKRLRDTKNDFKNDIGDDKKDKSNPFEKRSSYRVADAEGKTAAPTGLPEWFGRNDTNTDKQVSMAEYSKKWTQDAIDDFLRFDTNGDGYITSKESLAAVKKGFIPGAASSLTASAPPSTPSTTGMSAAPSSPSTPSIKPSAPATTDSKAAEMKAWYATKLKKDDKDGNGFLTPDEAPDAAKFALMDINKDGKIDLDEYVAARAKR